MNEHRIFCLGDQNQAINMLNFAVNSEGLKMGLICFQSGTPVWAFEELQQILGDGTLASFFQPETQLLSGNR